jgi:hypothetical protein
MKISKINEAASNDLLLNINTTSNKNDNQNKAQKNLSNSMIIKPS